MSDRFSTICAKLNCCSFGRHDNRDSDSTSTGGSTIKQRRSASPWAAGRMGAVASAMPAAKRRDGKSSSPERARVKLQDDAEAVLHTIATSKVAIAHSGNDADLQKYLNVIKSCESTDNHVEVVRVHVNQKVKDRIQLITLRNQWPLVFIKGDAVGGLDELKKLADSQVLSEWLKDHKYDLIVVGGGSGGLAAAKMAALHGKKVAVLDFVKPSPQGTTWGLGGTCVNVGCIPKKLMHQAALLGHSIKDAKMFGWKLPEGEITHNWENLRNGVQDHISALNWGYRVQLREKQVTYINSYGRFTGPFEISATNKKGQVEKLTADRFLIATGLRPRYPDNVPGAREYCVSSDDLFSLPYSPGKTLCIGASYVSLECAGFLQGLGYDVTVLVRSILLRGFDQDMAERIRRHMKECGIKFESGVPTRIEEIEPRTKTKAGRVRVHFSRHVSDTESEDATEEYNTVVMAIGRVAMTKDIGLDVVGVETAPNGKVKGRREQSLTCPYVYAIGDVLENVPELTPVAIQAGKVLMNRLYYGSDLLTEYDEVPTTVFTPLEYGCCGLSEEEAFKRYGQDNVIIYHGVFIPLEYTVPERKDKDHCYCKLICLAKENERVVGFHILAPNAGEITQGFGISLKLNATKADFDRLIGIHPTVAECFTTLFQVKVPGGEELQASGC
ncbi:Pyridine nucleotide-disulfide oxidoreductase [Trichostrongylus colubriformis]|uniref:thioredoxin-disulfide reductase (NADPH) n=1 Tax=Trichostrongylus colubriformis TaxID=6319 RepID=A0AAN8FUK7_TRICO